MRCYQQKPALVSSPKGEGKGEGEITKFQNQKSKMSFDTPPLAGDEVQNCNLKFKIIGLPILGGDNSYF